MTVRPAGLLEVEIDPSAPSKARKWVRTVLPDLSYDGLVLVSEMVANAVVHGRPASSTADRVTVQLGWDDKTVRIEVTNPEQGRPEPRPASDEENGRGLHILDALSHQWGWDSAGGFTTVWVEIGLGQ